MHIHFTSLILYYHHASLIHSTIQCKHFISGFSMFLGQGDLRTEWNHLWLQYEYKSLERGRQERGEKRQRNKDNLNAFSSQSEDQVFQIPFNTLLKRLKLLQVIECGFSPALVSGDRYKFTQSMDPYCVCVHTVKD